MSQAIAKVLGLALVRVSLPTLPVCIGHAQEDFIHSWERRAHPEIMQSSHTSLSLSSLHAHVLFRRPTSHSSTPPKPARPPLLVWLMRVSFHPHSQHLSCVFRATPVNLSTSKASTGVPARQALTPLPLPPSRRQRVVRRDRSAFLHHPLPTPPMIEPRITFSASEKASERRV